jgi:hypothetical protein
MKFVMRKLISITTMLFLWSRMAWGQNVFTDGFESGNTAGLAPTGWTVEADGWFARSGTQSYSRQPHSGDWYCDLYYNKTKWMFKEVSLIAGTTYSFSMWAKQDATNGATIDVKYGNSASSSAMTNVVVATTNVSNAWLNITADFTVATTGTYYIGIKGYTSYSPWYLCIDDVSLEALGNNPPNCANISSPTNGSVGVLPTATLNWSSGGGAPPATNSTSEPITRQPTCKMEPTWVW